MASSNGSEPTQRKTPKRPPRPPKGQREGEAECPEEPGKCNAWMPRHKRRCKNNAGQWTEHPGQGNCKMHSGATPMANMVAIQAQAIEYTKSIASEKAINPIDALLWAVRLSAGATQFWFDTLGQLPDGTPTELALAIEEAYGKERDRLARTSQMCIQVNLAAHQIRLASRQADLMLLVLEETFEQFGIEPARLEEAKRYAAGVAATLVASGFGND